MTLLQVLGVLVVAAAAYQLWLVIALASRRASQEDEQRRLTLDLLHERVLAARKARLFGEALQELSWSGYRKFIVVKKVREDAFDDRYVTVAMDLGADRAPNLIREDRPEVHPMEGDSVVLGRVGADILIDSGAVSTRHARIFRQGHDWFLEDLKSLNGTLVNMQRVNGAPVRLRPNDHIRIAVVDFRFELPGKRSESSGVSRVCSLYLAPHDGKPLPPFLPGQYLTFQLRIPETDSPTIRCYSLSDCHHDNHYRVTVKRLPPEDKPELPPGLSSAFFHDQVQEGDILDIQAPRGRFHLDPSKNHPVVLIGGGIGLTPVLSILNGIVASGSKRETWFFYGVRNGLEHVMKEHLERVARERENVRLHVCYSEPTASDVEGRDYLHGERVTVHLLKRLLPSNNYEFYTCGPPPMMNQVIEELLAWGVPESRIHYEAFGPATIKRVTHTEVPVAGIPSFKVTFARSGKECAWDPAAASLLDFAAANGVRIDSGCRAGKCGTCVTAVRSGQFSYRIDPGAVVGPGTCLTCISVPKADLVLDA